MVVVWSVDCRLLGVEDSLTNDVQKTCTVVLYGFCGCLARVIA